MLRKLTVLPIMLALAIVLYGCSGGIGSDFHGFEDVTIDELFDAFSANELGAKDTYQGKYVRVSGELSYVDGSGKFFKIDDGGLFTSKVIRCDIGVDSVRHDISKMSKGDEVVVRGKITSVGKLLSESYHIDTQYVDLASEDSDETKAKSSEEKDAPKQEATSETKVEGDEAVENVASNDAIILESHIAGQYGREITTYGGGSENDTAKRLGWFVPEGTYDVKNLDKSSSWEQVNYGNPEPLANSDGFMESTQFKNVLVKPSEVAEIYVPEGGCIYITSNTGKLELTKK